MRSRKLFTRKKAGNGEGRQSVIKHLLLPEDTIKELRLYKEAYAICLSKEKDANGNPIPVQVTWEQMFRRWMDNVGRFDKDVKDYVESGKAYLAANPPAPVYPVDPTEGEVWNLRYFFEKDGEQLEAEWAKSENASFSVKFNNRYCGVREMLKNGWRLFNDAGIEISEEQAWVIAQKRRVHREDILLFVEINDDTLHYFDEPENKGIIENSANLISFQE